MNWSGDVIAWGRQGNQADNLDLIALQQVMHSMYFHVYIHVNNTYVHTILLSYIYITII